VAADVRRPGLFTDGSLVLQVAGNLLRHGIWLAWSPLSDEETPRAVEPRRGSQTTFLPSQPTRGAIQRTTSFLRDVAQIEDRSVEDVAARWHPKDIVNATGLPLKIVDNIMLAIHGLASGRQASFARFFSDEYRNVVIAVRMVGATMPEAEAAASRAMMEVCISWPLLENPAAWAHVFAIEEYLRAHPREPRTVAVPRVVAGEAGRIEHGTADDIEQVRSALSLGRFLARSVP